MLPGLLSFHPGPWQGWDSHSLGASSRAVHTEGTWPIGLKSSYSASSRALWPRTICPKELGVPSAEDQSGAYFSDLSAFFVIG